MRTEMAAGIIELSTYGLIVADGVCGPMQATRHPPHISIISSSEWKDGHQRRSSACRRLAHQDLVATSLVMVWVMSSWAKSMAVAAVGRRG